ncbi:MAG: sulfur carrier protein ThiS adenylyltransferase ThiF [Bacteroidales bacterium]
MLLQELKYKTVGIAGCGGLGSNCAVALARVGLGKLVLADFDVVSESNLNRQYFFRDQLGMKKVLALKENLLRIMPDLEVEIHDIYLDSFGVKSIFHRCDIIVEAFDRAESKEMIIETVLGEFPGKYIVSGIGLAGWGNNESIITRREGNLIVCGDGINEVSETCPPLAPRVGIVSNMQANVVLELLLGECIFNPD